MSDWRAGLQTTVGGAPGWMTMRVGPAEFALPIDAVGEVLPTPVIARVPMAPDWVAGVVSVRGEVVPVIDLGERLLGVPADREGRLVLASLPASEERVGLLVDAVTGLVDRAGASVGERSASDVPAEHGAVVAAFASSSVTSAQGSAVPLLDLVAVLDLPPA